MATLSQMDVKMPLVFTPSQQHLDKPIILQVDNIEHLICNGADVGRFLDWVSSGNTCAQLEQELQALSVDVKSNRPLLTTFVPLVTFREQICGGGRSLQDSRTKALMVDLRKKTRHWRDAGIDTVVIHGYIIE